MGKCLECIVYYSIKSCEIRVTNGDSLVLFSFFTTLTQNYIHPEDAQADLSLRCVHRSFCWLCHKAEPIFLLPDSEDFDQTGHMPRLI